MDLKPGKKASAKLHVHLVISGKHDMNRIGNQASQARIDHIVVIARTLEEGSAYCEAMLGMRPGKGGEHARMGTHNMLLALGGSIYLEVIAINPAGAPPVMKRWFGMDTEAVRAKAARSPFLGAFAIGVDDIHGANAALPSTGGIHVMQRDALQWQITIPMDGELIENGAIPTLIQWPPGVHPTLAMPESGCRLEALRVHHPEPLKLAHQWELIGLRPNRLLSIVAGEAGAKPFLSANIATPGGLKTLSGIEPAQAAS